MTSEPEKRTREKNGWYAYAEVQPWKRWLFGFRYDWTEFPDMRGHEWAVQPYVAFMPSEFLRFRLGYKHTERDKRDGFGDNGGSARIVDELLLQATFLLARIPRIRSNLVRSQGDLAMRSLLKITFVALAGLALLAGPAGAADKIQVVATITDLKALTEAVGGDLVEVDALARGNQNPHDLEVRPSLMVKVRRADVIVMNGLELDQWAEVVYRARTIRR